MPMKFINDKIKDHIGHVDSLEVAWYGRVASPVCLVVECTKCGEVVCELAGEEEEERGDELLEHGYDKDDPTLLVNIFGRARES